MSYQITYKNSHGRYVVESVDPSTIKAGDRVKLILVDDPRYPKEAVGIVESVVMDDEIVQINLGNMTADGGPFMGSLTFERDLSANDDRAVQLI